MTRPPLEPLRRAWLQEAITLGRDAEADGLRALAEPTAEDPLEGLRRLPDDDQPYRDRGGS